MVTSYHSREVLKNRLSMPDVLLDRPQGLLTLIEKYADAFLPDREG
jgi:hypothetical protein